MTKFEVLVIYIVGGKLGAAKLVEQVALKGD